MNDAITRPSISIHEIAQRIHFIRGLRVILDADLASFYGETTKRFNQQVKRNLARFPPDFMFELTTEEYFDLRLQIATLKTGRGQHSKYLPHVFTEHGAIMAATLLNSPLATDVSVHVVRAFVEIRSVVAAHRELSGKLFQLDRKVSGHDKEIADLIATIQQLLAPPNPPKRPIGFGIPGNTAGPGPKAPK